MKNNSNIAPFYIWVVSLLVPVLRAEGNLAKGEIMRLHFPSASKHCFNYQVVGNMDGFDWIWRHLGNNYWKVVGKFKESPWSCQ